jgi:hypothetical protein
VRVRTLNGRGANRGRRVEREELLVKVLGLELSKLSLEFVFIDRVA